MSKIELKPGPVRRRDLDSTVLLMVAEVQSLRKKKGERDTEFVARIVLAYLNGVKILGG